MTQNRNRSTPLDLALAGEVRASIARQRPKKSVSGLASALGIRRATISNRINGHIPFSFSELELVAEYLGTSSIDLLAKAKQQVAESDEVAA